jgi:hypothetical protein
MRTPEDPKDPEDPEDPMIDLDWIRSLTVPELIEEALMTADLRLFWLIAGVIAYKAHPAHEDLMDKLAWTAYDGRRGTTSAANTLLELKRRLKQEEEEKRDRPRVQ